MKIFTWILGILATVFVFLGGVAAWITSQSGNDWLRAKAEAAISEKTGQTFKFEIFKLGLSHLDLAGELNDELKITLNGNFSLLTRSFDLNYSANAKMISKMPVNLSIGGKAEGGINNFIANGAGSLAGSNVKFATRIKDFAPLELKLDARALDAENLALIAMGKPYLSGKIDAVADIECINGAQNGTAKITAPKLVPNFGLLEREHNITLPKNFSASFVSDVKIANSVANVAANLASPIANLVAKNTTFNIPKNELNATFALDMPSLSALEPITKQKLQGKISADANLQTKAGELSLLNAKISGLGGTVNATLKESKIDAQIKGVRLEQVLKLAALPPLAVGQIDGVARISNALKNPSGDANLQVGRATAKKDEINKFVTSANLKKDIDFLGDAKIKFDGSRADLTAILNSEALKVSKLAATYNMKSGDMDGSLKAEIPSLDTIFGSNLNESLSVIASAKTSAGKVIGANADINGLGGAAKIALKGSNLNAEVKNIDTKSLFLLANQKPLFGGNLNANFAFDSVEAQNLNGKGEIAISNGVLNAKNLSELTGKKFPEAVKFEMSAKPTITNSVAYFNSNLKSSLADLSEFKGSFDLNKFVLDSAYVANVPDLSKLEFLTGRKLLGAVSANGKIGFDKKLSATLNTNALKSQTTATLDGEKADLNMSNFAIEELLGMLGYDKFYLGRGNGVANIDLDTRVGAFRANVLEGRLAANGFTNAIKTFLGRDITNEVYRDGLITGTINGDHVKFDAQMSSPKSNFKITGGTVNTATKQINVPILANIEKTDIELTITGTTEQPKYSFSSNYLTKQLEEKVLNKLINNGDAKDTKKKDEVKDIIKGLKGLF